MQNNHLLKGKKVLITGASSGIGRSTALALAQMGCDILVTSRRHSELEKLALECQALGARIEISAGDLNNPSYVEELALKAGDVDILINSAGVLTYAPILEMTAKECMDMFNTNVLATFALTSEIARSMVKRKSGHIVMITSTAAREVYKLGGVYCATKHALSAITRSLRLELQGSGIRVTEIAPGMVYTPIRDTSNHPAVLAAIKARTIKALTPQEVAQSVVYAIQTDFNCCSDLIELRPRGAA